MKTLLVLALSVSCFAQEAKIMIVERPDSQRLAKAYQRYKDAQVEWEDAKTQVAKTYTHEKGKPLPGWQKVQFSADFRAIVPESSQYAGRSYSCNGWPISLTNTTSGIVATGYAALNATGQTGSGPLLDESSILADLTVRERK